MQVLSTRGAGLPNPNRDPCSNTTPHTYCSTACQSSELQLNQQPPFKQAKDARTDAISFEISVPPHTTAKDVKIVLLPGNQTFLMKIGSQPEETNQFNAKATYLCWQMSDDGNTVC